MSTQTTISQLKELGLHGMAEAFEAMMVLPSQKRPGLDRAVEKMVQMEACMRDKKLTERLLKAAKLRYKVFIEDITCFYGAQSYRKSTGGSGRLLLHTPRWQSAHRRSYRMWQVLSRVCSWPSGLLYRDIHPLPKHEPLFGRADKGAS